MQPFVVWREHFSKQTENQEQQPTIKVNKALVSERVELLLEHLLQDWQHYVKVKRRYFSKQIPIHSESLLLPAKVTVAREPMVFKHEQHVSAAVTDVVLVKQKRAFIGQGFVINEVVNFKPMIIV